MDNQEVFDALEKMKNNIRTLGGIIKKQDATINELKAEVEGLKSNSKASGNRKVNGDPEKIALALYLLHEKGLSIQSVSDTGLLSYSKTYGVYSWDDDYREQWLEEREMLGVFEDPLANSQIAKQNKELYK